ncbi:MAG: flippase [Deltaproteobacteria bacterium]|nr:flippase [Deltaproteobacteria bacterium]
MTHDVTAARSSGRRILKNTAALVVLRVLMPALSMILVFAISRILGTDGLGQYTLALTYLYFFVTVAPLGLYSIITRDGVQHADRLEEILNHSVTLGTIASLALTPAMAGLGPALGYDRDTAIAIAIASLALLPSTRGMLYDGAFVARERMDYLACVALAENAVKVGLAAPALLLGYGLETVIVLAVAGRVVANVIATALLRSIGIRVRMGRKTELLKGLLGSAPTFVAIAIFATLYWRIDVFMLSKMGTVEDVGRYGAAWRILELALVVPHSFCLSLYPQLAAAVRSNRAELARLGRLAMRFLAAGSLPLAAWTTVVSDDVMGTLYGTAFRSAGPTLTVLVWTLVPYGWVRYHAYVLVAAELQRIDLAMNVTLTAINVALNLYLIPAYGPWGAGLATLVSMLAYAVAQVAYLRRRAPGTSSPLTLNLIPLVAALAAAVLTWLTSGQHLAVRAVVPAAAYVGALFLGGFFESEEIATLQRLGRRCRSMLPLRRATSS